MKDLFIVAKFTIKDMIKRTLFSVSNDENRPIYNGALLKVEDNTSQLNVCSDPISKS